MQSEKEVYIFNALPKQHRICRHRNTEEITEIPKHPLKMTCSHNSLVEWSATKQGTPTGYGHLLLHVQTTR